MSIYTGSGVAVCTPFDSTGAFNANVYESLIKFHVEKGTDAIVSCGTTGEASTLNGDEHLEVVKTAVVAAKKFGDEAGKKVPVIAGGGGNDTANCCAVGKKLQQAGVDALMYVTPYYNKTSQAGLIQHYTAIAKGVDIPIIIYNVPSRTGLNIQPKTLATLAKLPNITAVKEASGDISQIVEVFERCGGDIDVYSGNDDQILPILSLGGKGVISTIANIAPRAVHDIVAKFMAGDIEGSRALQFSILPLVRLLFSDVNPMPVKAAVNLLGFDAGTCRLPLVAIEDGLHESLKQGMKRFGIL
ncbi:MAG: 4-hydroxy-tetrahydrodipicolinate synthase [Defluviitaleaceae bacterium]|nr:4-hydroxy-tetrahydrodipicolinate synthase [Defluviitaleaceae bacterium]